MKNRIWITSIMMLLFTLSLAAQENKDYYFNKTINGKFEEVSAQVTSLLEEEGFTVITKIDLHTKFEEKLDNVSIRPYRILGACNASLAYENIQIEENIGLFIPCKILIKELEHNTIEVVMVNPSFMVKVLGKSDIEKIAKSVTTSFEIILDQL